MPDWSVEAMKIVIDSETEKFSAGLQAAKDISAKFANAAGADMTKVDTAILKVGTSIDLVKSKLGIWLQLAETALSFAASLMGKLEQAADLVGWGDEAKEVTSAVNDLGVAIVSGLGAALSSTRTEVAETVGGISGLKQPTEEAGAAAQEAASSIGKTLVEAVDRVATASKNFKIASYDAKGLTDAVKDLAQAFKGIGGPGETWQLDEWQRELHLLTEQFDDAKRKAQEMDDLAGKAGQAVNQFAVLNAQDKVKGLTDRVSELMAKIGEAKDKIAELSKEKVTYDDTDIDKHIAAVQRETWALSDEIATLGMAAAAKKEWLEVTRALRESEQNGRDPSPEKVDQLRDDAARRRENQESLEDGQRKIAAAKASEEFSKKIEAEIEMLRRRGEALGMSAPAAAAYLAEQKALADAVARGFTVTERQIELIRRKAAAEEENKEKEADKKKAEADEKAIEASIFGLQKQLDVIQQKTRALYDNSVAGQAAALADRTIADMHAKNIEMAEKDIEVIRAWANEVALAQKQLEDQQKQLQNFKSAAQAVTGELENAFRSWTQGSAIDVRKMVQSMLADLALLTFKQSVTNNLSSLMTSGLQSLFQARAGGGPVTAGVPYVVGEKRPELFLPATDGYIVPSVPSIANSTSTSSQVTHMPITLSIDARGATPDAVKALEIALPAKIMTVISEARERGML